jgi:hypothetical protein
MMLTRGALKAGWLAGTVAVLLVAGCNSTAEAPPAPAARRYRDVTKHTPESVRGDGFRLDWANKPALYYLTDLERAGRAFGERGYRLAELEGGLIAGRAYLAAGAVGRGAP